MVPRTFPVPVSVLLGLFAAPKRSWSFWSLLSRRSTKYVPICLQNVSYLHFRWTPPVHSSKMFMEFYDFLCSAVQSEVFLLVSRTFPVSILVLHAIFAGLKCSRCFLQLSVFSYSIQGVPVRMHNVSHSHSGSTQHVRSSKMLPVFFKFLFSALEFKIIMHVSRTLPFYILVLYDQLLALKLTWSSFVTFRDQLFISRFSACLHNGSTFHFRSVTSSPWICNVHGVFATWNLDALLFELLPFVSRTFPTSVPVLCALPLVLKCSWSFF